MWFHGIRHATATLLLKAGRPDPARPTHPLLANLRNLNGAAFDRKFVSRMIDEHQEMIDCLRTARDRGVSSDLGALIDGLPPTLKLHLEVARSLRGAIEKT